MNGTHSEAAAQEQTVRAEVADRELAALNGVLQHFSPKQASYDLYDNLCERINYFARSTPTALIVWGISILSVALLLAGGMFFLLRGGMLSPEKLPIILAAYGCLVPLPGLLMLTVGILMKVNCRRKLELSRQEFDDLSRELYQHFLHCPNCPISPEYTNPLILNQLQNLIYYGKTDTVKDSLNNLLAASNRKAIARYLKLISRNTAGHGSNVIFLPPHVLPSRLGAVSLKASPVQNTSISGAVKSSALCPQCG